MVVKEESFQFTYGPVLELTFKTPDGTTAVAMATLYPEGIRPKTKLYKWVTVLLPDSMQDKELTEGVFVGRKCRGFVRIQLGGRGAFLKVVKLEKFVDRPRRVV